MAEAVETVWQHLDIPRCVLAGQSMGGYVSLACMAEYPDRLAGVCLFHSSPFADNDAKKASRAKEIRLVQAGKLMLICNTSIPNGFADENLQTMTDKIEFAKEIARRTSPEGAVAILEGMRNRPDRTELLTENKLPLQFILGKHDHYISFDELYPAIQLFPNTVINVLEHSGHSGYFEEPEKSMEYLSVFLEKCYGRF
jgi:pimeloyl-ACP methyl ester carboxylesterase